MIEYDKVLSIKEVSDYILNVFQRDPTGYNIEDISILLKEVKKESEITFGDLLNKISGIKIR